MAKIKLYKRIKYAGDVHKELLELGWDIETAAAFLDGIPDVPNIEYAPVIHGYWIPISDGDGAECSECGEYMNVSNGAWMTAFRMFRTAYKYCPACGAKMDGEEPEA